MSWIVPAADRVPTPHLGRQVSPVEVVVYHNTATGPGGGPQGADRPRMERWLRGESAPSSTNFVITRAGDLLQGAPLTERTWHAGRSSWRGREGVNAFSIGVDFENAGPQEAYTSQQVATLRRLVPQLVRAFPKLREPGRHVGHKDITPRKIDPNPGIIPVARAAAASAGRTQVTTLFFVGAVAFAGWMVLRSRA